jgi:hypothetical protein
MVGTLHKGVPTVAYRHENCSKHLLKLIIFINRKFKYSKVSGHWYKGGVFKVPLSKGITFKVPLSKSIIFKVPLSKGIVLKVHLFKGDLGGL